MTTTKTISSIFTEVPPGVSGSATENTLEVQIQRTCNIDLAHLRNYVKIEKIKLKRIDSGCEEIVIHDPDKQLQVEIVLDGSSNCENYEFVGVQELTVVSDSPNEVRSTALSLCHDVTLEKISADSTVGLEVHLSTRSPVRSHCLMLSSAACPTVPPQSHVLGITINGLQYDIETLQINGPGKISIHNSDLTPDSSTWRVREIVIEPACAFPLSDIEMQGNIIIEHMEFPVVEPGESASQLVLGSDTRIDSASGEVGLKNPNGSITASKNGLKIKHLVIEPERVYSPRILNVDLSELSRHSVKLLRHLNDLEPNAKSVKLAAKEALRSKCHGTVCDTLEISREVLNATGDNMMHGSARTMLKWSERALKHKLARHHNMVLWCVKWVHRCLGYGVRPAPAFISLAVMSVVCMWLANTPRFLPEWVYDYVSTALIGRQPHEVVLFMIFAICTLALKQYMSNRDSSRIFTRRN